MDGGSKISRVRTFAGDYSKAKSSTTKTETPPTPKSVPKAEPGLVAPPAQEKTLKPQAYITKSGVATPRIPLQSKPFTTANKTNLQPASKEPTISNELTTDISSDIETVSKTHNAPSHLEGHGSADMHDMETGATGSIVTDTKHEGFKLLPAIGKSIVNWFKDTEEEIGARRSLKEASKPKVESVDSRTNTLLSAAEHSALPISDDHQKITVRLRQQPEKEYKSGLTIKKQEDVPEPAWESTKPPTIQTPTNDVVDTENLPIQTTPETPVSEGVALPANREKSSEATAANMEIAEPPSWESANLEGEENTVDVQDAPSVEEVSTETEEDGSIPKYRPTPERNNKIPYLMIIVIVVGVVLGILVAVTIYKFVSQPGKVLAPNIPTVINTKSQVAVPWTGSKDGLLSSWQEVISQGNSGVTHVYPIVATGDGLTRAASVEETVNILGLRAPGSFTRNINGVTLGVIETSPFMILEVENFDTAFGGMLQWERVMVNDLSPIFGNTTSDSFADVNSQNRDLRVSPTNTGREVFYTFLSRNIILIANDRLVLEVIVTSLK